MKSILKFTILSLCCFSSLGIANAQELKESPQLDAKIARYYKALRRSAKAGPLFEKFHSHWLAEHTDAELETFLKKQAESKSIADYQVLALYQIRRGQEILAIQTLKAALEIAPKNANINFSVADLYSQALDFEQALKYIKIAVTLSDDEALDLKIGKTMGVILIRGSRQEEAVAHWGKLIKKHPKDKELIEDLIDLQLGEGLREQAIKLSQKLIQSTRNPYKKAFYKLKLANVYDGIGKQELAIKLYIDTLDSTGQGSWLESEIIAKVKEIYLREGNQKALLDFYVNSIKKFPNRILLKKDYADTLASQDKIAEAEELYRDIIKLTPGDKTQVENLVKMLIFAEQPNKAKQWLEHLIKDEPTNADYLLQLADIYNSIDDKAGLKQTLSKHYQLSKKDELAQLNHSRILATYKLKNEAKSQLDNCHKQFPKSVKTKLALIDASIESKEPELIKLLSKQAAEFANRDELLQIAEKLSQVKAGLTLDALELLKSKLDEHKTDIGYIEKLCKYALVTKNAAQAIPWATSLLHLAEKSTEIERVLKLCLSVIHESKSEANIRTKLASKPELNVAETCLLASLYEHAGQHQQSNDLITGLIAKEDLIGTIQSSRT